MKTQDLIFFLALSVISVYSSPAPPCPSGNVYFPDSDCGQFWQCSNGVAHLKKCPDGLNFNPQLDYCDYPENAGCNGQGWSTTIRPTTTTTTTRRPTTTRPTTTTTTTRRPTTTRSTTTTSTTTSRPTTTRPTTTTEYYYWRDYSGIIPFDAFPVGVDKNRDHTYVGQVFLKNDGVFPTTIYSDNREIWVPYGGGRKAGNFNQILCSQRPQFFKWISTNKTNIQLDSIGHHLVRGGVQDNDLAWVNIGRIQYQGDTVVGKVMSSYVGNAQLWFTYNTKEITVDNYEVLAFDSDWRYKL